MSGRIPVKRNSMSRRALFSECSPATVPFLTEFPDIAGPPVAISSDGSTVLLEIGKSLDAIDLNGKRLYSVAVSPNAYRIAPDFSAVVAFSWGSDAEFQYYRLK